jgi:hypothetical protein
VTIRTNASVGPNSLISSQKNSTGAGLPNSPFHDFRQGANRGVTSFTRPDSLALARSASVIQTAPFQGPADLILHISPQRFLSIAKTFP